MVLVGLFVNLYLGLVYNNWVRWSERSLRYEAKYVYSKYIPYYGYYPT